MKYKLLLAALLIVILLGCVWEFYPLGDASVRLDSLPKQGFGFTSEELPFSPEELARFGKAKTLRRIYRFGADQFVVTVIDGSLNRHAVHDPCYCFRGAGWVVLSQSPLVMPGGDGELVRLQKDGKTTEAVYWFTDGESRHASPTKYWRDATMRRLTLGHSGNEELLVILQPVGQNPPPWSELFQRFDTLLEL